MMLLRFKVLLVLLALAVLAGCANNTGQYQTPSRGGWDNFRA
jgi:predicted small lipoprotein YifL